MDNFKQVHDSPSIQNKLQALSEKLATSIQINDIVKKVKGYIPSGTYDEAAHGVMNGKFRIFNYVTHDESIKGIYGHWICIDNRNPLYIVYFDPYGLSPDVGRTILNLPNYGYFSNALHLSGKEIRISYKQYQDFVPYDESCGVWSAIYAIVGDLHKPPFTNVEPSGGFDLALEEEFLSQQRSIGRNHKYVGNHRIQIS